MKRERCFGIPNAARNGLARDQAVKELRAALALKFGQGGERETQQSIECETSANGDNLSSVTTPYTPLHLQRSQHNARLTGDTDS